MDGYYESEYFTLHEGKRRYLDYLIRLLRRSGVMRGRVLDIGAGLGFFLQALSVAGFEGYGLEKNAGAAAQAATRCTVAVGDADEPLPFPDAHFRAVTLFDVIEHLHHVPEALGECRRVLEPGGKLFVITLNAGSLARPFLGKNWSFYLDPTHVTLFSRSTLRRRLVEAKFEVERMTTISNFYLVGEGNPRLKVLRQIARVITTPYWGDSLLAIARR